MTFTITWNNGILEAKTQGDARLADLESMVGALLTHEKWSPGGALLVDHSELNAEPINIGQVRALADMATQARAQLGRARIAHAVSRDLEFGLVRMWENFVSLHVDARLGCFRSREHAVAWLKTLS